ncbi:probable pectin methylesterase CGR2 [Humulus lupulus]|uniref:probable pectin methylesterase CGR2 n=1 Tax=Humulus lupulus TaxID=3486 RepID=UPI002B40D0E1|nr:probable pectin methylesterase CGR2 [Humulus lupulus]
MARRQVNPSRRLGDGGPLFSGSSHSKQKSSPLWPIALVLFLGALFLLAYTFTNRGGLGNIKGAITRVQGDDSCTMEVQRAIPILKKAYGDSMQKVLHIGPDTCSVVSELLKEDETEAWGVEPYDMEDADRNCKALVRKGIVRVSDVKFPLPYREKSFSLVIVSDTLDYLSPRYLNRTVPDLARVSADGLIMFTGYRGHQRSKVAEVSKFGRAAKWRSSSWWVKYFGQTNLEQNEAATKKFDQAATKMAYISSCQIFHLMPFH